MPDWVTHTLVGWMTGKTIKKEVGLIILGSILPDLVKINLIATWFRIDCQGFLNPLHTPLVALIIAGIIALFFIETKTVFFTLSIGIATHFLLDFFLIGTTRGIQFLFPFSWEYWRFNFIIADYRITLITLIVALLIYICFYYKNNPNIGKKQRS
jgi:hypothetical protein